jgi:ZipA, C-terminal FtsZ-binding domain
MNELTLSLLAIGLSLIFLLVAFNWWQERKIRKAAERAMNFTEDAATLEEDLFSELDDSQQEVGIDDGEFNIDDEVDFKIDLSETISAPYDMSDVPTALAEDESVIAETAKVIPLKTLPDALSVEVDLVAMIDLPAAEKGERLSNMLMRLVGLDKPVSAYGLNESQLWQVLCREQASELFGRVAYSLQLADRAGAVSEETLKRFHEEIALIVDELGAQLEWMGSTDTLNFAKDLDAFCLEVDQLVNLHVINGAGGRFMATKFNSLADANNLTLDLDGKFLAKSDDQAVLFAVVNMEKIPFSADMLKATTLKGVTFQMDIARTPNCTETFNHMVNSAKNIASALSGVLVDDHQRELSDAQLEKIRQQLKLIQVQMTVRGIIPGSPLALRLFA